MRRTLLAILITVASAALSRAADGDLFPYPQPPAGLERLDERCDFIITNFWRQCDFKAALSKNDKLRSTFADWISFMPFASADTVHAAIDRLLASNAKNGPVILALGNMARDYTYSDTAELRSTEIFLPFARAVVANKKISAADKAPFAAMIRRIENVRPGKPVQHLEFVTPEGNKTTLDNFRTQMVVLFFVHPDCSDCSFARVRLSADYNISTLIDRGLLTFIEVDVESPSEQWLQKTVGYPSGWVVGAMPDADDWFELNSSPDIMILDGRHRVLATGLSVDDLMTTAARVRQSSGF